MQNYKDLVAEVIMSGDRVGDRTGVGTRRIFGRTLTWDLRDGFPATTVKKLAWKAVVGELLWFMSGSTNVEDLRFITHGFNSDKSTIWDGNYETQAKDLGYSQGELGPVYGKQWRNFAGVDQLQNVINSIKADPYGRRHLVSAWNPEELSRMALPPCHYCFQFFVSRDGHLDLMWNQRSVDVFLGLPFNIASYGLLLVIVSQLTGLKARNLTFVGGDIHIYNNHVEQCGIILDREPRSLPTLEFPLLDSLEEYLNTNPSDYTLINYNPHGTVKAPMAV